MHVEPGTNQAYHCSALSTPIPFLCSRPQAKLRCVHWGLVILLPQQEQVGPGSGSACVHQHAPNINRYGMKSNLVSCAPGQVHGRDAY